MLLITTDDGERLEARRDGPEDAHLCVVLCHPHPLRAGTMHAPLMNAVTDRLVARGLAVLRFNFRGVGESTGTHGYGLAERADVTAAFRLASESFRAVALAGWSFGATTALGWMASAGRGLPYVGIAPSVAEAPPPSDLPVSPKRIIQGDRDRVVDPDGVERYAQMIGADLVVVPGSGHFFYLRESRVGDLVADFLTPPRDLQAS